MATNAAFVPPPYPHDRLASLAEIASSHSSGMVDLSIGTPSDPPPSFVADVLAKTNAVRGYPPPAGTIEMREAASAWLARRFGARVEADLIGPCIGTKELVAGLPHWLRLRQPQKDTVLYPEISYPTYAMGAQLAGCRAVPVPVNENWQLDLAAISPSDIERALALWVNTPANPTGGLDDLSAVVQWGHDHGVLVLSDECYAEFTWDGAPQSVLSYTSQGVLAVHSLSKRSNLAGLRVGFYTGDPEVTVYLQELRKHAGFMLPGPTQEVAAVVYGDDDHVEAQRRIYWQRLVWGAKVFGEAYNISVALPGGGFYLWVAAPNGDDWGFAKRLATDAGVLVSPGEFYGPAASGYVRIALVQPQEQLDLVQERLAANTPPS